MKATEQTKKQDIMSKNGGNKNRPAKTLDTGVITLILINRR